jgi:hypothetical protein
LLFDPVLNGTVRHVPGGGEEVEVVASRIQLLTGLLLEVSEPATAD